MDNNKKEIDVDKMVDELFEEFEDDDIKELDCRDTKMIEDFKKKSKNSSFSISDYAKVFAAIEDYRVEYPTTTPVFDISCDDNEKILWIVSKYNMNIACFSLNEVKYVREYSHNPIIIRNPIMNENDLKELVSVGGKIESFVVDNLEHMELVKKYFPETKFLIYYYPKNKGRFGCDLVTMSLLIKRAMETNTKIEGIYLAGGNEEDEVIEDLDKAIKNAQVVFNHYKVEMEQVLYDEEYLDELREKEGLKNKTCIINTYFTEEYVTAVEQIYQVKIDEEAKEIRYYMKNADLYLGRLYMNLDDIPPKKLPGKKYNCIFYGPSVDTSDSIIEDVQFMKLKVDDYVTFEKVGCFSYVFTGSEFNGFLEEYNEFEVFNNYNFAEE